MDGDLISTTELLKRLRIPNSTFRDWIRKGKIRSENVISLGKNSYYLWNHEEVATSSVYKSWLVRNN